MKLVLASTAFVAGVVVGLIFGLTPDGAIERSVWYAALAGALGLISALLIARRSPIVPFLFVVLLFGIWRGTDHHDALSQSRFITSGLALPGIDSLRSTIHSNLTSLIDGDAGALAAALLTGERAALSSETVARFRGAGLSHLLAISGLHVAMVGGLAMYAAAALLGKRGGWFLIPPAIAVALYATLAGLAPPVTRAALMFGVLVVARFAGRGTMMLPTLALAAIVMVAIDPVIITALSFQLSFAAMVGIALVAPRLDELTEVTNAEPERSERSSLRNRTVNFVKGSVIVSVAATLATAPIVGLYFGEIPVWGIAATTVALPAVPILIVSSAVTAAVGAITTTFVAEWTAFPTWLAAEYVIQVATWFDAIPAGQISSIRWTPQIVITYYAVGVAIFLSWNPVTSALAKRLDAPEARRWIAPAAGVARSTAPLWIATVMFIVAGAAWVAATAGPASASDLLRVRFLSIESGESIWVTSPNGNTMLIDAGVDPDEVADQVSALLGPFDNRIDLLVLTHPDADHVGGMTEVVRRFDIGTILHAGEVSQSDAFANWEDATEDRDELVLLESQSVIGFDHDVFIEVLTAGCPSGIGTCSDLNNSSAVLRIVYGDVSVLLTGDIEAEAERRLVRERVPIQSTVLKVAHHGSQTSSTSQFIETVAPHVAVFTVGYGPASDRFGHPDPAVYRRVANYVTEQRAFRTDTQGAIEIATDGTRLWVPH